MKLNSTQWAGVAKETIKPLFATNSDKERLVMQRILMDEGSTLKKLFQLPLLRLREQYKSGDRENAKCDR